MSFSSLKQLNSLFFIQLFMISNYFIILQNKIPSPKCISQIQKYPSPHTLQSHHNVYSDFLDTLRQNIPSSKLKHLQTQKNTYFSYLLFTTNNILVYRYDHFDLLR